jgi:hypothetical protein
MMSSEGDIENFETFRILEYPEERKEKDGEGDQFEA